MLKGKTFMPGSLWPFPKLTPASGLSFWQLQMLLVGCAVAVTGIFWLMQGITNPIKPVLFTFIIGNCTWLAVLLAAPVIKQKSPWDWIAYLGVLLPVAAVASWIASVASRIIGGQAEHLLELDWVDIRDGMFFSLVVGVALFISGKARSRLEGRNRELEKEITVG